MTESNLNAPITDDIEGGAGPIDTRLRGDALGGAEQRSSVDHTEYEELRDPDVELRLDGESDSLYSDGIDVLDDTEAYAGTDGDSIQGMKG